MTKEDKVIIKKKLTLIETFSGIGAQVEGLKNTGLFDVEVIATSDVDKDAVLSYATIHCGLTKELINTYQYPDREEMVRFLTDRNIGYDFKKDKPYDWFKVKKKGELEKYYLACALSKNVGDISKVEELPYADMLTFSFPCFVEGTLVLTNKGYKPIEEVKSGDMVLTHKNKYEKVVNPMINYANKIYKVCSMPSEALYVTGEHPFYVRRKHNLQESRTGKRYRRFDSPAWINAKDLSKDYYVGTAINQKEEFPEWDGVYYEWGLGRRDVHSNIVKQHFDKLDFWYLIGRYLGDGWIRTQGGIIICSNKLELGELLSKIESVGFNYCISEEKTVIKVHISCKELGLYCEQFGRGAVNKHLTKDIINLPTEHLKAFLNGYIAADGTFVKNYYKITSVSRELIYGVAQCVAKAYHRPFSIYFTQRPKTCVIEGRTVNQRDTYQLTFKFNDSPQDKAFYEDGYIWSPVNDVIEEDYDGLVYNMEVENDNSYVVQNIIVHNCQSISVAGRQEGIKEGETRSGLVYEIVRLVEKYKEQNNLPKYLLLENVKNLVGKKFIADFENLNTFFDEVGYNVYWKVINGKDCGVPQNRERVFGVYIRKDIDTGKFEFPKPFDSGLRLKDVLEDTVDEKYYISQEKVGRFITSLNSKTAVLYDSCQIKREGKSREYNEYSPTLNARDYKDPKIVNVVGKLNSSQDGVVVSAQGISPTHTAGHGNCPKILEENKVRQIGNIAKVGGWDNPQAGRVYAENGISPTLNTMQGGDRQPKILKSTNHVQKKYSAGAIRGRYNSDGKVEQQLEVNGTESVNAITTVQKDCMIVEDVYEPKNFRIRKLTPTECWILMGFKKEQVDKCMRMGLSNSALYKQAGNSIITNCISLLGEHLYKAQYDNTYICFDEEFENFTQPLTTKTEHKPMLVGGVGEINFGKQYRQGNRVYDGNAIAMCILAEPVGNTGGCSYLYMVENFTTPPTD